MIRNSLVILFAIAVICLPAYPQQESRGIITGQVMDATGAVLRGATVTATQIGTNVVTRTTTTDTGNYTLPALPVATYDVRVEASGFRPFVMQALTLPTGSTLRVNARLEIGSISEQVVITAQAAQLDTENAKIQTSLSTQMIEELPLEVGGGPRSVFSLAQVTPELQQDVGMKGGGAGFAGSQRGGMGATLDGVSVMGVQGAGGVSTVNTPPVEAIGEFNVETHGFTAEFGRATGGRLTFVSKSGTNQLHGSLFEIARNDSFDARRYFESQKGAYKQHNFGGSIGGPVYIPGLYDGRNRTFFFGSAELFRNRVGATGAYFSVPTPEMYQGDFSNWVDANGKKVTIYDPATTKLGSDGRTYIREPFKDNKIPVERFSNFAKAVLKYLGTSAYPNTTATPGTSAYVRNNYQNNTGTLIEPWNKWSIKFDHAFNDKNKLSFLYGFGESEGPKPGPNGFPGLPGVLTTEKIKSQVSHNYRATYSRVFTPTVIYTAFGGYNTMEDFQSNPSGNTPVWSDKYGICLQGAIDCNSAFPNITFSDYSTWAGEAPVSGTSKTYTFGSDLAIVRGNHTFKAGYLFERMSAEGSMGSTVSQGLFGADRRSTSIPGNNNLSTGGGNSFASFLLGEAYNGSTGQGGGLNPIFRSHSFYFQDDWKVSSKLTLNLGLRYEFALPQIDGNDRMANFNPTKPNPGAGGLLGAIDFAGTGEGRTGSRTLYPGWYGGIGPRLGFAYSLNAQTVIRGGAARTFAVVRIPGENQHFDGFSVLYAPSSKDNGITSAFNADVGFPAFTRPPKIDPSVSNGNFTSWWKDSPSRMPETYDFTLSIQRKLSESIVAETSYNGTMGVHLASALFNANQLPYGYIQAYGISLLNSPCDSKAAQAAGIKLPYANIIKDFPSTGRGGGVSVAQCLRPYPMYTGIDMAASNGERRGHSTFHSWSTQITKRYSKGLTLQGSYLLSKLITDSDENPVFQSIDTNNPGLEKSISKFDRTHMLKFSFVWELPFGRGKQFLQKGPLTAILGGWRLSGIGIYQSGLPIQLTNSVSLPIFNTSGIPGKSGKTRPNPAMATTLEGWVVNRDNPDWLGSDRYFQPKSYFGTQPTDRFGNTPRYNGLARLQWDLVENLSLGKSLRFKEDVRLDIRAEGFNIFNRSKFNPGSTNVDDPTFGQVRSTLNEPRRMQFALKMYF